MLCPYGLVRRALQDLGGNFLNIFSTSSFSFLAVFFGSSESTSEAVPPHPAPTPAAAKTAVEGLERAFLLCGDVGSDTDVSALGNQLPSLNGEFGID